MFCCAVYFVLQNNLHHATAQEPYAGTEPEGPNGKRRKGTSSPGEGSFPQDRLVILFGIFRTF